MRAIRGDCVVDRSALVDVLLGAGDTGRALQHRTRGARLHAPQLLEVEVGEVLRRQVRAGAVDASTCRIEPVSA